ncbi:MAG: hypothetical protein ABSG59_06975 [Verrucomicrobiota bacterium]|jgi:hypothetical protein
MRPTARANGFSQTTNAAFPARPWLLLVLLLGATLAVLFYQSFQPQMVLFANDVPLGALKADPNRMAHRFTGVWRSLSFLGSQAPAASLTVSTFLQLVLSPEIYLKVYAPFSLFFVGFCAWVLFRQLQFNPVVCALGGVAAGLNMHFFSIACWGLGSWNIAAGTAFLALAAFHAGSIRQVWARAVLAGLAVGLCVMEGFDLGAILSVYVGVYVLFWALTNPAPVPARVAKAVMCEALVVFFAGFIAIHTMASLVQTQITGVASMDQDVQTKQQRWNAATQWSLPKTETLGIVAPGLFGYRMGQHILNPDHSSAYWGLIGQDPRIALLGSDDAQVRKATATDLKMPDSVIQGLDTPTRHERTAGIQAITRKTGIYWRYSGTGEFAGTLVALLALFALANVGRPNSPFSKTERLTAGFWGAVALFSLLAAWGRFGFLYRLLYQLPYFSTIRNPIKFLHPFHIAWIILAAYGMEALYRGYLRPSGARAGLFHEHLQQWWAKVAGFDKMWGIFMLLLFGAAACGLWALDQHKGALITYLEDQNFASDLAVQIAGFCLSQAVWFLVYLVLSVLVIAGILSGAWSGTRMKWAWIFLGTLMIADLSRADTRWVRYYDYGEKYALNPVVELLQDKPYEHRVIGKLEPRGPGSGITPGFGELYFFWLQNDFPYHNIQTLDFAQAPHIPDLDRLFLKNFELTGTDIHTTDLRPAVRLWQLTNTRFILATASGAEMLNARADPTHDSFQIRALFNVRRKPGVAQVNDVGDLTAELGEKGSFAVIEFTRALPRAKLYSNWLMPSNDDATLQILAAPSFDPARTVLVSQDTPVDPAPASPSANPGSVEITRYQPKYVQLHADVITPSVLLLNDRWAADWKLWVDGRPAKILRCNYIMRGVFLTPGAHKVEFRFRPPIKTLCASLCAFGAGIALAGYLIAARAPPPSPAPSPAPPAPAKPAQPPPPNRSQSKRNSKGAG